MRTILRKNKGISRKNNWIFPKHNRHKPFYCYFRYEYVAIHNVNNNMANPGFYERVSKHVEQFETFMYTMEVLSPPTIEI